MSEVFLVYPTCSDDTYKKVWLVLRCADDRDTIVARIFSQPPPLSAIEPEDGWEVISGEIAIDLFDEEEKERNQ